MRALSTKSTEQHVWKMRTVPLGDGGCETPQDSVNAQANREEKSSIAAWGTWFSDGNDKKDS